MSAELVYDKLKAAADVTRKSENCWEFEFTQPKQLNGIKMCLDNGNLSVGLGGLSVGVEESSVYSVLPQLIAAAIDSLPDVDSGLISTEDGVMSLVTDLSGKSVTITADAATGKLISMKCPSHKLSVKFSGQEAIAIETEETDECRLISEEA